jgi:hypothetical protein
MKAVVERLKSKLREDCHPPAQKPGASLVQDRRRRVLAVGVFILNKRDPDLSDLLTT